MTTLNMKTDNVGQWESALNNAIRSALDEMGTKCVGHAREVVPVKTGWLRDSIEHEVRGKSVDIGTNVYYAAYVELGTETSPPRPYLRPALENHEKEYVNILVDKVKAI